MSSSLGLCYFMLGDFNTHKEIGSITDNSNNNYSINDHKTILSNSKELFSKSSEEKIKKTFLL